MGYNSLIQFTVFPLKYRLTQTFSDKLWTSAALLLFEERGGTGFTGMSPPYNSSISKTKSNHISNSKRLIDHIKIINKVEICNHNPQIRFSCNIRATDKISLIN